MISTGKFFYVSGNIATISFRCVTHLYVQNLYSALWNNLYNLKQAFIISFYFNHRGAWVLHGGHKVALCPPCLLPGSRWYKFLKLKECLRHVMVVQLCSVKLLSLTSATQQVFNSSSAGGHIITSQLYLPHSTFHFRFSSVTILLTTHH